MFVSLNLLATATGELRITDPNMSFTTGTRPARSTRSKAKKRCLKWCTAALKKYLNRHTDAIKQRAAKALPSTLSVISQHLSSTCSRTVRATSQRGPTLTPTRHRKEPVSWQRRHEMTLTGTTRSPTRRKNISASTRRISLPARPPFGNSKRSLVLLSVSSIEFTTTSSRNTLRSNGPEQRKFMTSLLRALAGRNTSSTLDITWPLQP